jgi:hypothetical protein
MNFREGAAVDVLSSMMLAMTSAFAFASFLLSGRGALRWFWLVIGIGALFLSMDELLQFHERMGYAIRESQGPTKGFRNWNDVIMLAYGIAGILGAAWFLPEILRHPRFLELLLTGFVFFAIHTGIDSLVHGNRATKVIPEESMKLIAGTFFALAALAALMSVARGGRNAPREPG